MLRNPLPQSLRQSSIYSPGYFRTGFIRTSHLSLKENLYNLTHRSCLLLLRYHGYSAFLPPDRSDPEPLLLFQMRLSPSSVPVLIYCVQILFSCHCDPSCGCDRTAFCLTRIFHVLLILHHFHIQITDCLVFLDCDNAPDLPYRFSIIAYSVPGSCLCWVGIRRRSISTFSSSHPGPTTLSKHDVIAASVDLATCCANSSTGGNISMPPNCVIASFCLFY